MHNSSSVYFVKHLYMFRAYLQPIIRRYTLRIQQLLLIVLFRRVTVVLAGFQHSQDNSHLKRTVSNNCCIHTVYLLMMGRRYARNT